jgi:hypothetical protein
LRVTTKEKEGGEEKKKQGKMKEFAERAKE